MRIVAIPYEIKDEELWMPPLKWPNRCACCGQPDPSSKVVFKHSVGSNADGFTSSVLNTTQEPVYKLKFGAPYCKTCVWHPRWFYYFRAAILGAILLAYLFLTLNIIFQVRPSTLGYYIIQFLAFCGLAILALRLRGWLARWVSQRMNPGCSHYRYAVWISSDASYIYFVFFNDGFASEFGSLNGITMPATGGSQ
jgi:hypothetical protein